VTRNKKRALGERPFRQRWCAGQRFLEPLDPELLPPPSSSTPSSPCVRSSSSSSSMLPAL